MSVEYKEFGVRLNFTPTIAGDVIRLKLRPEVSTLDFTNGILLSGFRIPALNTRRAETDVELRDGQSFAIAGLLNNLTQTDRQAIPWISRVPIIGTLFRSRSIRAEQTELMVLVTPRLVRALDPDEVPTMPVRPGAFINPCRRRGPRRARHGRRRERPDCRTLRRRRLVARRRARCRRARQAGKLEDFIGGTDHGIPLPSCSARHPLVQPAGRSPDPRRDRDDRAHRIQRASSSTTASCGRDGGRRRTPPMPPRWPRRLRLDTWT